jgi:hypothetical protein
MIPFVDGIIHPHPFLSSAQNLAHELGAFPRLQEAGYKANAKGGRFTTENAEGHREENQTADERR